jgi:hypothetical protein
MTPSRVVRGPAYCKVPRGSRGQRAGYLTGDPSNWAVTDRARDEWELFVAELKRWLLGRLQPDRKPTPADAALLDTALQRLTEELLDEESAAAAGPSARL